MSAPTTSQLDYAPNAHSDSAGAWRLLRLAAILWASLVLCRHATYWGGVIADRQGAGFRVADPFPFAEVEAGCEAVILFATLVVALGHRESTPGAIRALRFLGAAFIVLVVADVLLNLDSFQASATGGTRGRVAVRTVWQLVSKAQLLVVPAICAIGPRR